MLQICDALKDAATIINQKMGKNSWLPIEPSLSTMRAVVVHVINRAFLSGFASVVDGVQRDRLLDATSKCMLILPVMIYSK